LINDSLYYVPKLGPDVIYKQSETLKIKSSIPLLDRLLIWRIVLNNPYSTADLRYKRDGRSIAADMKAIYYRLAIKRSMPEPNLVSPRETSTLVPRI